MVRPTIRFGPTLARSLSEMQAELSRLMEEAASGFSAFTNAVALDLTETSEGVFIDAEMPGVAPADLEVNIDGDLLHLRGERRALRKEAPKAAERRSGKLERTIRLPFAPEPERVEARFEHGLLTLFAPRPDAARGVRVDIKIG